MKLVYAVTSRNAPQLLQLALLFEKLGSHAEHEILVVSCPSALTQSQEFGESVKRLFRDVSVMSLPQHVPDGNVGRNQLFLFAATVAATGHSPWIWMEHATPCDRGWLDQIQYDYNGLPADRGFMGCIEPTFFYARGANGEKQLDSENRPLFLPRGKHMRFGVYPASFGERSTLIKFLPNNQPFEVAIQEEVVHSCHPYDKFITVWQSRDFDVTTKGYVLGKQTPGVESEIRKVGGTTSINKYLVIHGCRDSSLPFIIQRRTFNSATKGDIKDHYVEKLGVTKANLEEEQELVADLRVRLTEKLEENADLLEERNVLRAKIEELQAAGETTEGLSPKDFEALADQIGERDEEIVILKALVDRFKQDLVSAKKKPGRPKKVS